MHRNTSLSPSPGPVKNRHRQDSSVTKLFRTTDGNIFKKFPETQTPIRISFRPALPSPRIQRLTANFGTLELPPVELTPQQQLQQQASQTETVNNQIRDKLQRLRRCEMLINKTRKQIELRKQQIQRFSCAENLVANTHCHMDSHFRYLNEVEAEKVPEVQLPDMLPFVQNELKTAQQISRVRLEAQTFLRQAAQLRAMAVELKYPIFCIRNNSEDQNSKSLINGKEKTRYIKQGKHLMVEICGTKYKGLVEAGLETFFLQALCTKRLPHNVARQKQYEHYEQFMSLDTKYSVFHVHTGSSGLFLKSLAYLSQLNSLLIKVDSLQIQCEQPLHSNKFVELSPQFFSEQTSFSRPLNLRLKISLMQKGKKRIVMIKYYCTPIDNYKELSRKEEAFTKTNSISIHSPSKCQVVYELPSIVEVDSLLPKKVVEAVKMLRP